MIYYKRKQNVQSFHVINMFLRRLVQTKLVGMRFLISFESHTHTHSYIFAPLSVIVYTYIYIHMHAYLPTYLPAQHNFARPFSIPFWISCISIAYREIIILIIIHRWKSLRMHRVCIMRCCNEHCNGRSGITCRRSVSQRSNSFLHATI